MHHLPCFFIRLEETLPSKKRKHALYSSAVSSRPPPTFAELLTIPVIRALTLSGHALNFITTAFDVVFVLYAYTPVEMGGLGLFSVISTDRISPGIADRARPGHTWSHFLRNANHPTAKLTPQDCGNKAIQPVHVFMVSGLRVAPTSSFTRSKQPNGCVVVVQSSDCFHRF
ncbi:hypothetical protein K438DRAFT_1837053 [Mycena galopus ATCC 62051]|nr:hypothetical protein K438DRAFT_1837053 [Mycena galopus ATCC 62051]